MAAEGGAEVMEEARALIDRLEVIRLPIRTARRVLS
jgi:hypothetical protein